MITKPEQSGEAGQDPQMVLLEFNTKLTDHNLDFESVAMCPDS